MNVLFMGTPDFAVPVLNSIFENHTIVSVVTQPDRPKGRGHSVQFTPIKQHICSNVNKRFVSIPLMQPEKIDKQETISALTNLNADIFVVAAYGEILPKKILTIPKFGCVNVHASLLPKYRGASPIHYAIKDGEKKTGITIIQMDRGIDTGDIILKREIEINEDDSFGVVHDKLSKLGGECIAEALKQIEKGKANRVKQDDALASYAPVLKKTDGLIDWHSDSKKIINHIRSFDPWPGTFSYLDGQLVKIWKCSDANGTTKYEKKFYIPGTVISSFAADGIIIKTGDGAVSIEELQVSGGKRMTAKDFLRGRKFTQGAVFNDE